MNVDVNWKNSAEGDRTSLHVAAIRGDTKTLSDLIANNGDVNVKDVQGSTCLHLAVAEGHDSAVSLLLETPQINPFIKDSAGRTPAYISIFTGRAACAKLLLSTALAQSRDDWTEFHLAALEGDSFRLNLLPSPWPSPFGVSPLHAACAGGSSECVETLLAQADNFDCPLDMFDRTPLHYAAASGNLSVVKALLAAKTDINARDQHAKTALHFAAGLGHTGKKMNFIKKFITFIDS